MKSEVASFLAGDAMLGRDIIERIAQRSRRYGTKIRFDAARNRGFVAIPQSG